MHRAKSGNLWHCERGATAIEYGIICALIVLVCVAGMALLGGGNEGMWTQVSTKVDNAM